MDAARLPYFLELATESQSSAVEGALARWWTELHFADYDGFAYQKHVGRGQTLEGAADAKAARVWYHATRKRVDLAAYRDGTTTIVEFKDHIDGAAVRQARDYRDLWAIAPSSPPVVAVIVAGRTADPGAAEYASQYDIKVELAMEMKL